MGDGAAVEVKSYIAELHAHTVLSPCAEVEMIPPLIVPAALAKGINLLAITDHNASANVIAVQHAAQGTGLTVVPGMEFQTREDVHVLCLFDTLAQLAAWQDVVNEHLPPLENNIEYFGEQFVVDATGGFIGRETRLLLTSADLSIEQTIRAVSALGGWVIPAHVDRKANGLIAHLGFVPPDAAIDTLEISRNISFEKAPEKYPQIRGYPLVQDGDAHRLNEFLGVNEFTVENPTIAELRMAVQGEEGRSLNVRAV